MEVVHQLRPGSEEIGFLRQEKTYALLCRPSTQVVDKFRSGRNEITDGEDASRPVLLQVVLGAFHIDVLIGCEPIADLIAN